MPGAAVSRPVRILLVEDNPLVQAQLREALGEVPGLAIAHVARTARDATEWLQRHPDDWDLAVVDIFLADGHGFQVLRGCRERRPWQRAVVYSNYTRDPVREHARLAGADAVFDKSFEAEELVAYCAQRAGEDAQAAPSL